MEAHGPLTTTWVKETLAHVAGKVQVLPVLDLAHQTPVDAYEIPTTMRQAVHLIHGGDVFPYAPNTTRKVDLDHTQPYAQGGKTAADNLAPMTRTHHRIKTHSEWECRQPWPGILLWRDPHGAHYLIDNTGTRQLAGGPRPRGRPPPRRDIGFHASALILGDAAA